MKILFFLGIVLVSTVHADVKTQKTSKKPSKQNDNIESKQTNPSSFQIGGNYTHVNLKIHGEPSFQGNLGGLQGSYEYRPWNNFYGAIKASWKEGNTESSEAERSLVYVDVQERLGYTYASDGKKFILSLFSGFGYRHLGQELHQSRQPSIQFDYNEFYIPVGFLSGFFFNSWCSLGLNLVWMPQVYPTVKIVPLPGARWIIKSTLNNILVELPLSFFVTQNKRYSLIFKPFYEHWEDGKTTAKTSTGTALGLPANIYNFWGAELNFAISF